MKKAIVITLLVISVCGCGKKEEIKNEENPNQIQNIEAGGEQQERKSTGTLQDFDIVLLSSNIEEEMSEFVFEITNTSNSSKYINAINAKGKDSEGNILITLAGVIESEIGSKEKIEVTCSYGGKLEGITGFEYEID